MKPASSKSKGLCKRCKSVYDRTDSKSRLCQECKAKCSTCGVKLDLTNQHKSSLETRKNYICVSCVRKRVKETRGNKGFNQKSYDLNRHYGITEEVYSLIKDNQNSKCKICKEESLLVVDHNHYTGEVRGLLCRNCNSALGLFKDSKEILLNAFDYLEEKGDYNGLGKGKS